MAISLAQNFVRLGGREDDVEVFADRHDIGLLAEPLRSRIWTAKHDCDAHYGREALVPISLLRSPWQQYLLRVERVGAARAFDRDYPGRPRTAVPYASNHQKGTAADMGGTGLWWLIDREHRYGLDRTVSSENWHFEAVGNPTTRIIPYPGSTPAPPKDELIMDDQAKAAFSSIDAKLSKAIQGLLLLTARVEELERLRFKPTTRRTRLLMEHAGVADEPDD